MPFPSVLIAALRGGSGKTILSVGIVAALADRGLRISPFKKGPDYIDAGWLALAAGRPCYNLDTFLVSGDVVRRSFQFRTARTDLALIEGNRGLYDGIDIHGRTSTAELAKLIQAPVVLCLDCTKTTRTMAAVVAGCHQFDPEVPIKGVVLNRVAGRRHEKILRDSIEHFCGIPVLGAIPKLAERDFPERHMGLVPTAEHLWAMDSVTAAARAARENIDLEAVIGIAEEAARTASAPDLPPPSGFVATRRPQPKIGILKDSAFQFYYPENIEALAAAGAQIVFASPLGAQPLPALDGLYIGGGFPETHAQALAENVSFRNKIKQLADDGMPIYAECGGLMYLGRNLVLDETVYPMAGVLPLDYGFCRRPQGHGYTVALVERDNPFFPKGAEIRGHEFHYSQVIDYRGRPADLVFAMQRGKGIHEGRDGLVFKNVLATYTHIHALGTPDWAKALVARAAEFRGSKK